MPQVTLTSLFVKQATCPAGTRKIDFFDTKLKGFMLEVRDTGRKTFYQRYSDARGKTRQYKIGTADTIPLEQARRKARQVVAEAALGPDPQAQRQERRTIPTLRDFAHDRYLPHVQSYKRTWRDDATYLRLHILPAMGSQALDAITSEQISEIITRMRERNYAVGTCNRVIVLLRYMYNLARKWKVPGVIDNPANAVPLAPEPHRQRFLTEDETRRLLAAIAEDQNQMAAQAILLLLLTGARCSELLHATWDRVDWQKRTLLVPRSKSGKPRYIALNEEALAILRSRPRLDDNPYIFPAVRTGRPSMSLFNLPWPRIRTRAGLRDVRLHDLRHSYASFLVNRGVSLYVVQQLLGHTQGRMTQRYAHLAPKTLQDAAEVVANVLRKVETGGRLTGNNVPEDGDSALHSMDPDSLKNPAAYAMPTEPEPNHPAFDREKSCG